MSVACHRLENDCIHRHIQSPELPLSELAQSRVQQDAYKKEEKGDAPADD